MKLAGPLFEEITSPESWVSAVKKAGYDAADLMLPFDSDDATVGAYLKAAAQANIVIAEVGAWSNPISPDSAQARSALIKCQESLNWAERVGARCCVNIAGSRNPAQWDGPHPENFLPETFDLIVQRTREIIDAVKPKRTFYALETMPWIFPSSPDEYLELIRAIDRPGFAVHLDPVNMINTPARVYRTGDFIRECFAKLGPHIKSCHAKDIIAHQPDGAFGRMPPRYRRAGLRHLPARACPPRSQHDDCAGASAGRGISRRRAVCTRSAEAEWPVEKRAVA